MSKSNAVTNRVLVLDPEGDGPHICFPQARGQRQLEFWVQQAAQTNSRYIYYFEEPPLTL